MNLIRTLTRPATDLSRAVLMPLKALFVVGLCGLINAMTFDGTWWVKWVALGMGIATVVALLRGLRALMLVGGAAWLAHWLQQRATRR